MLPSISHSTLQIIGEISALNVGLKKYSEKVTSYGTEKDRVKTFLDSFSRNLSWFLGLTAFKLIKVKDDKEAAEKKEGEKDSAASSHDKMQDLIIQSNLLSGGIENRFITLFSADA